MFLSDIYYSLVVTMENYDRAVIDRPQILQYGDDVDMVYPTTWGQVYTRLEQYRLRTWTTMTFAILFASAAAVFYIYNSMLLSVLSFGLAMWYFRNYFSASMDYKVTWGERRCLIPNLKVE